MHLVFLNVFLTYRDQNFIQVLSLLFQHEGLAYSDLQLENKTVVGKGI